MKYFKKTSGLNRGDADEQKEVSRIISNEVEKLAFELLDDLHSAAESKGFIDKPAEVKKRNPCGDCLVSLAVALCFARSQTSRAIGETIATAVLEWT